MIDPNDKKLQISFKEQHGYLTEETIIKGFHNVFGYDCPFFARLIYLFLAHGFDKSKIGLSRIIQEFQILLKEDQGELHNKLIFKIYDYDRDGELTILNLLNLQQSISVRSKVGQEIF